MKKWIGILAMIMFLSSTIFITGCGGNSNSGGKKDLLEISASDFVAKYNSAIESFGKQAGQNYSSLKAKNVSSAQENNNQMVMFDTGNNHVVLVENNNKLVSVVLNIVSSNDPNNDILLALLVAANGKDEHKNILVDLMNNGGERQVGNVVFRLIAQNGQAVFMINDATFDKNLGR